MASISILAAVAAISWAPLQSAAASTGPDAVTVFLSAPDLPALEALTGRRDLSHAARIKAVQALLPSPAQHSRVAAALRSEGMTVTGQTSWSISASGTPATVRSAFGSRPALAARATSAERAAATGALPDLPPSLSGLVTAAFPTTDGQPPVFHHATARALSGADYRNAYTSAALTSGGTSPYSGHDSAATLTIATIQLSGWNASDLTHYAGKHGPANFSLANQLTQVAVGGADPTKGDSNGGATEVDLDQESILSTDPYAHQRAYFARNTNAGFADDFGQVLDDVLGNSNAIAGGDPHIVALSSSWGGCEADTGTGEIKNTLEPIMTALQAAGVTVFSASGDDGIYDCGDTSVGVDYPGSSPHVISVGGSNLQSVGASAANNGSNWIESAWSCGNVLACTSAAGSGGSGGGVSSIFDAPAYQSSTIKDSPFAGSSRRLVPDISAPGDTQTGFEIYSSTEGDTVYGGTSLASPVSAALFTNLLAAHDADVGITGVLGALYSAYADSPATAFRDITSGSNGSSVGKGDDPSVSAQSGYDTVSGLGGVLWPAVAPYLFSSVKPTVTASLSQPHLKSSTGTNTVTASWHARRPSGGLALGKVSVTIKRVGSSTPVYGSTTRSAVSSHSFTAAPGSTYTLRVIAHDVSGDVSTPATAKLVVPVDDERFTFYGKWSHPAGADVGASHGATKTSGAYATAVATARAYAIYVRTGPGYGRLAVTRGSKTLRTIDLYSATKGHILVQFYGSSATSRARRTFSFRYTGSKNGRSTARTVNVDALYAAS